MKQVKFKSEVKEYGNSHFLHIPVYFIKHNFIKVGETYDIQLKKEGKNAKDTGD